MLVRIVSFTVFSNFFWFSSLVCSAEPDSAQIGTEKYVPRKSSGTIRLATYNVSFNRSEPGKLIRDLKSGDHPQCQAIASVIRAVEPDVLLLNEVDYSTTEDNAGLFHDMYLTAADPDLLGNGPWPMPHRFSAEVNTGEPSHLDLNRNQRTDDPEDAWGFGRFAGQYGMAVLSRYEIDLKASRTFQRLRWSELPNALQPAFPETGEKYYSPEIWSRLRLPSKSLWDVVVKIPGSPLHVLASHPTPPVFDGPEDRNGCRNHDEIRLLLEYIHQGVLQPKDTNSAEFWQDDQGRLGCLASDARFVIAGDLNCDPHDGDSRRESLLQLLAHHRVQSEPVPVSQGAVQASQKQAGKNISHRGPAQHDTGDFNDEAAGNMRIDYVLPSKGFEVVQSGVFWPEIPSDSHETFDLLKKLNEASDHHLVWVDVKLR